LTKFENQYTSFIPYKTDLMNASFMIVMFIIQDGSSGGSGEVETIIDHKQIQLEFPIYLAKGGRTNIWHATTSLAHWA
jgi:hypothetical protein